MVGTKQTMPEKEFTEYAIHLQNGTHDICSDISKLVMTSPTPLHDLNYIADHMKLMVEVMHRNANTKIESLLVDIKRERNFENTKFKSQRK